MRCFPFRSFYFALLICSSRQTVAVDTPTVEFLYARLQATISAIENCKLVLANKGNYIQLTDGKTNPQVNRYEFWIAGDHLQMHQFPTTIDVSENWRSNTNKSPIPQTTQTLGKRAGSTYFVRPTGDQVWSEFVNVGEERKTPFQLNYLTSASIRPLPTLFAPFVTLRRAWVSANESVYVNSLAQIPVARWKMAGTEIHDGINLIVVEVAKTESPASVTLSKHPGQLELVPIWRCWFVPDKGYLPVRIVDAMNYRYNGKEFTLKWNAPSTQTFEATEIKNVFDDFWYPIAGMQETFSPDPSKPAGVFDPDLLVDLGLSTDLIELDLNLIPSTRIEWQVNTLEKIASDTSLWCEPPNGCLVVNMDTDAMRIQGRSHDESQAILTSHGIIKPQVSPIERKRSLAMIVVLLAVNVLIVLAILATSFRKRFANR